MPAKKQADFDFEGALEQLEELVASMEDGELSLEDSLKYFEKGVKLHRQCHSALTDAEQRVNILSEEDNYSKEKHFEDL